jgi:isopentenyl-diphosphate delta-isomerase
LEPSTRGDGRDGPADHPGVLPRAARLHPGDRRLRCEGLTAPEHDRSVDPADELLDLIDEDNRVIGQATRRATEIDGLLHRTVNVLLFDTVGRVCLQRRAAVKRVAPLAWDISVAEHVRPGESNAEAAIRGLREELSVDAQVSDPDLFLIHETRYTIDGVAFFDRERAALLIARSDAQVAHDPGEVEAVRWASPAEIDAELAATPEGFTPWFNGLWRLGGPAIRE